MTNEIRAHLELTLKENESEKGLRCKSGNFWGFPDGSDVLWNNWRIYYEIEEGQHHPDTNVLKYWPYLEENNDVNIVLIQWLNLKPRSPNRWKLAQFVAEKIEHAFPERFIYIFLEFDFPTNVEKLGSLKDKLRLI